MNITENMELYRIFKEKFQLLPNNFFVAGGSVLATYQQLIGNGSERIRDYDLYFKDFRDLEAVEKVLLENKVFNASVVYENANSICYDTSLGKLDLVKIFYPSLNSVLDSFDIETAKIGVDLMLGVVDHSPKFPKLAKEKEILLSLNTVTDDRVVVTLKRVAKYLDKGYYIKNPQLIRIINRLPGYINVYPDK